MDKSLLEQLADLQNPEPTEFNVDQWDYGDGTAATLVDAGETVPEDEMRFGRNLRHRQSNDALQSDARYRDEIVDREQLDSSTSSGEDDEYSDTPMDSDQFERTDSTVSDERPLSGDEEDDAQVVDVVKSFATVDVDRQNATAKAVQQQTKLYDQLLSSRIRFQKILSATNQLPHSSEYFNLLTADNAQLKANVKNCYRTVQTLMDELLALQNALLARNPATQELSTSGSSPAVNCKRGLKLNDYQVLLDNLHTAFMPYRNDTLKHWFDKTRVGSVRSSHKDFSAFETDVLQQIDHILANKERLKRRTQLRRTEYNFVGERRHLPTDGRSGEDDGDVPDDDHDVEVFDDDDFYEQLLRQLIASRTAGDADPAEMGRQWVKVQKLRSKRRKRKTVDTRASKGRGLRMQVHSKLINFSAPVDPSSAGGNDEARAELFRSLFGSLRAAPTASA